MMTTVMNMNCDARVERKLEARLTFVEAAKHREGLSASCSPTATSKPICYSLEGASEDSYELDANGVQFQGQATEVLLQAQENVQAILFTYVRH